MSVLERTPSFESRGFSACLALLSRFLPCASPHWPLSTVRQDQARGTARVRLSSGGGAGHHVTVLEGLQGLRGGSNMSGAYHSFINVILRPTETTFIQSKSTLNYSINN